MKRQLSARATLALMAMTLVVTLPGHDTPLNSMEATAGIAQMPPGTAALRAYLNPETGGIDVGVAPASEPGLDAETRNALRRDTVGLVEVHHPDGSVSMDLQGRFQCASVARVDGSGKIIVCTDHVDGATHVLHGNTSDSTKPEVK